MNQTSSVSTRPCLVVLATVLLAGGLAACSSAKDKNDSKQGEKAHRGGALTMLKSADVTTLDPVGLPVSGNETGIVADAIYDDLVYTRNGQRAIQMGTAKSLTSSDGVSWTLKLRPGVKFSDGTAYDAASVKYNWARIQDPANHATNAPVTAQIDSMAVASPTTLTVKLKAKNEAFPYSVTRIARIGSPTAIKKLGSGFAEKPVGAGPFVLKKWVHDSEMVLVRNPRYWNAPLPNLNQVTLKVVGDESQRLNSICSNEAELAYIRTVTSIAQNKTKNCGTANLVTQNGGQTAYFNTRKAPFNDVRVRRAVAMAWDPNRYSKVLGQGIVPPAKGAFATGSPYFASDATQAHYDKAKAQALFDAASRDLGGPVTFTWSSYNIEPFTTTAKYMQAVLNAYKNVKVQVDLVSSTTQAQRLATGGFQLATKGGAFGEPDPTWTYTFQCNAKPSFTGWCDQKFDAAITRYRSSSTQSQRDSEIKAAQKVIYAGVPALWLEPEKQWLLTTSKLRGFGYINDGIPDLARMGVR